jgi:hypothetical protein
MAGARFRNRTGPASSCLDEEIVMAKGQMRVPKEKKKPKADKNRPKQLSAYKLSQMQSSHSTPANPFASGKKA